MTALKSIVFNENAISEIKIKSFIKTDCDRLQLLRTLKYFNVITMSKRSNYTDDSLRSRPPFSSTAIEVLKSKNERQIYLYSIYLLRLRINMMLVRLRQSKIGWRTRLNSGYVRVLKDEYKKCNNIIKHVILELILIKVNRMAVVLMCVFYRQGQYNRKQTLI